MTEKECNFRLSRGRKSVECAFGMLASKFREFERPIGCNKDLVKHHKKCLRLA